MIHTKRCPFCGATNDERNWTCTECNYPEHETEDRAETQEDEE